MSPAAIIKDVSEGWIAREQIRLSITFKEGSCILRLFNTVV